MTQPAIFFGHGNPMNALGENIFSKKWREIGFGLPKARAILVVSAHYETSGIKVACANQQKTIHDFYGFPDELFAVQYPARGDFALAREILEILGEGEIDENWGLDHGAWSVLIHTHPDLDIPVLQLGLDRQKSPQEHYNLARKLSVLRDKDVLIVGSGNIVHNLRMMNWQGGAYDWAKEFDDEIVAAIRANDHQKIINFAAIKNSKLAIPSNEHFLPLLYILGLKRPSDKIEIFNQQLDLGSISMTGVMFS